MKTLILIIAVIAASMQSRAEEDDYKETDIERPTSAISEGLTIPKHLELQWKNKKILPTSIKLKNPFQENIKIFTSNQTGNIGYPGLEIECYDPDSKSWRLPLQLPGSFAGKNVIISYGQHKDFTINDDFWWFVTDRLPEVTSKKTIRIRLVYSFGAVHLRSEEFNWTLQSNKNSHKKNTKKQANNSQQTIPDTPPEK